jgi:oleandomycin transport system permease protein
MTTTITPSAPPAARLAAPKAHIGPVRAIRHGRTLAWRTLKRIQRNPEQLLDVTLQPIIFVTLFVFLFGGAIAGMNRHEYLQFVLPGVMAQTVIFASIGTGFNLNTDISKGIFDRFRSMPIARSAPLSGAVVGDFFRYVASLSVVLIYGAILGFRIETNAAYALAGVGIIIVFAFSVGWIWSLLALHLKTPQTLQGVGFMIMFPLTFGSNVFVQSDTLPGWLQAWVKVNPVTAVTGAIRGLMVGGPIATPVWHTLVWSAAITVVFAPLAVRKYRRIA